MEKYTIGDKEYTRQELLEFGRAHYPKFYWIKRGIGIGLMATCSLPSIYLVYWGIYYYRLYVENDWAWSYHLLSLFFFTTAATLIACAIVGIVLFALSFVPVAEDKCIRHALDYYRKQEMDRQKREARLAAIEARRNNNR